ncbi:helix-turn-helix domain-containing protein [Acerihabitans arboris]|uniref:HTH cro/C1-type domain-containing protein n=1 Tax=Acerihabitans arboris TaxID=2691583 RepID=A0A845SM22_9GAMM|nr:helix-turn-helix domain-containing protein [Acerihabitans arboris]NDL64014.1 hypothetical protein [Acerihabitans arboris]
MHRLIAQQLINRHSPLISSEMRFLRHELNLSRRTLGIKLGVEMAFIAHWERSGRRLPHVADISLRILYATTRITDRETHISIHLLADADYPPSSEAMIFIWSDGGYWLSSADPTPAGD